MLKFTFLFLFISVLFINLSFSKNVSPEIAKQLAKNLYYERINQIKSVGYDQIELFLVSPADQLGSPVYYIFNVNENDGFVIISADDIAKPVIGYSFNGSYNPSDLPPSFKYFLETRENEISYAVQNQLKSNNVIEKEWQELVNIQINNIRDIQTITPLLLTDWGQGGYYDDACPESGGEQAVVGCVALSMAMVMKYYNYPAQGQGSHSYSYPAGWPTYWPYGTLTANFGATTYNWYNMPLKCTSVNNDVATFLFHCGVAVDMYYDPSGSGSQTYSVHDA
ncbi:MAG: C10 family peptidase, partial [Bacteroidota bacterium]